MKLVAQIKRIDSSSMRALRCTFPVGTVWPLMREGVLQRHLGARPYAEGFYTNDNGQKVVVYMKGAK